MDALFKGVADTAKKVLLADPTTEDAETTSDRVGAVVSTNVATIGQAEIDEQTVFGPAHCPQDDMRSQGYVIQTASLNPGRLIHLKTAEWSGVAASFTQLIDLELPQAFYSKVSRPAKGQSRYFKYVRTGYTFNVQVNVSAGVSGSVLAVFIPPGVDARKIKYQTYLMLPSVLINVGASSSGVLKIPYINFENYCLTDSTDGGHLTVIVWSPLTVPSGTANSMSVSVYGSMDDLDFQNPRPVRQGPTRQNVDIGPGPGNLPLAGRKYTTKATDLALCGEVATFDPSTCGTVDGIKNLYQLLTVPLPLDDNDQTEPYYEWASTSAEGTEILSRFVGLGRKDSTNEASCNHLTRFLSNCFGMWRGSIIFTLTVFGNPLSKGRLRMAFFPNLVDTFTFDEADNALYVVCDIGLQTSFELVVPYSWKSWLRPTYVEANNDSRIMGKLSVFVNNRLIVTSATPPTLNFMITARVGDDFEFVAPVSRGVEYQTNEPIENSAAVRDNSADMAATAGLTVLENTDHKNQDAPAPRTLNSKIIKVKTIKADHMDIQSILARGQRIGEITLVADAVQYWPVPTPVEGHMAILKLFAYWAGDITISIYNATDNIITVAHTFMDGLPATYNAITSMGSIIVKPKEFASMDVPFYSDTPARKTRDGYGSLVAHGYAAGKVEVYVSFRRVNVYMPVGVPKRAGESRRNPMTLSMWDRDLTAEGIESNPGPMLIDPSLYKPHIAARRQADMQEIADELQIIMSLPGVQPLEVLNRYAMDNMSESKVKTALELKEAATLMRRGEEKFQLVFTCSLQKCIFVDHPQPIHMLVDYTYGVYSNGLVLTREGNEFCITPVKQLVNTHTPALGEWARVHQDQEKGPVVRTTRSNEWLIVGMTDLFPWSIYAWQKLTLAMNTLLMEAHPTSQIQFTAGPFLWINELFDNRFCVRSEMQWYRDHFGNRFVAPWTRSRLISTELCFSWLGASQRTRWVRDLTLEGIEPNPGPPIIGIKNREIGTEYTIIHNGVEYSIGRDIERVLNDEKLYIISKPIKQTPLSADHLSDTLPLPEIISHSAHVKGQFGLIGDADHLDSWYNGKFGQQRTLAIIGICLGCLNSPTAEAQGKFAKKVEAFRTTVKGKFAKTAFSVGNVFKQQWIEDQLTDIACAATRSAAKAILRAICYGVMFFSNPSAVNTIALGALLAMDISNMTDLPATIKDVCNALLEGDFPRVADAILACVLKNTEYDGCFSAVAAGWVADAGVSNMAAACAQGPLKAFNDNTLGAKNLLWWLNSLTNFWTKFKEWLNPTEAGRADEWLNQNEKLVLETLSRADELVAISTNTANNRTQEYQDEVLAMKKRLTTIKHIILKSGMSKLLGPVSLLLTKLSTIPMPPTAMQHSTRLEPIGILISGLPGCGKSLFATSLMTAIAKELQSQNQGQGLTNEDGEPLMDWVRTVFMHPTGSEFFDNYEGQFFHIMDDFGQIREEGDVKLICNIISAIPFSVPMAHVDEKGHWYTSQMLIATTNLQGHNYTSVLDSKAIARRFPHTLTIKPTKYYSTPDGKLNTRTAISNSTTVDGSCWDIEIDGFRFRNNHDDTQVSMQSLAETICNDYMGRRLVLSSMRRQTANFSLTTSHIPTAQKQDPMVNIPLEELISSITCEAMPFESLKEEKELYVPKANVTDKVKKWWDSVTTAWNKFRATIMPWLKVAATILTILSALTTMALAARALWSNEEEHSSEVDASDKQRPYGNANVKASKVRVKIPVAVTQGPSAAQEMVHLHKATGYLRQQDGTVLHFLGLYESTALMYAHCYDSLNVTKIGYNGVEYDMCNDRMVITRFEFSGGMPTDLMYVEFDNLPFQFKRVEKYLDKPTPSMDGYLLFQTPETRYTHFVTKVTSPQPLTLTDDEGKDQVVLQSIRYETKNEKGMCGGILVQKINGAWKIVGMHHAGDSKLYGYAVPIHHRTPRVEMQGVVTKVEKVSQRHFTPTKSKLCKSVLNGVFPVEMGPAPLHAKDKRIEVEIEGTLVARAAKKYDVDVFNPSPNFNQAMFSVTSKMFAATGRCGMWTIEEALNGGNEANKIDMTTSPGVKYTRQGLTKKDLILSKDGKLYPSDKLRNDVEETLKAITQGKGSTIFAATLKDEVRPLAKIAQGKTRCIEACSVDYVVAHRMILGQLFNAIYTTDPTRTGVAVGINPYTDFQSLAMSMKPHWYAMDYSTFDGSLSEGLMRQAAEVLASCHSNPGLVIKALEPVIVSTHLVDDEMWTVRGGMPSGSPCTSVLNSVCNLLVVTAAVMDCGLEDPSDMTIVTYGDDVLFSTDYPIQSDKMPDHIYECFGMTATSADKSSRRLDVVPANATFLKRSFRVFPGTQYVVGQLDLNSMKNKIMWCHSHESFKQQFENFTYELVLHGEKTYNEVMEACKYRLDKYKMFVPQFPEARKIVFGFFFE